VYLPFLEEDQSRIRAQLLVDPIVAQPSWRSALEGYVPVYACAHNKESSMLVPHLQVSPNETVTAMHMVAQFGVPYNLSLGIAIMYGLNDQSPSSAALTRAVAEAYKQASCFPCAPLSTRGTKVKCPAAPCATACCAIHASTGA
jgi:hypothetical protein